MRMSRNARSGFVLAGEFDGFPAVGRGGHDLVTQHLELARQREVVQGLIVRDEDTKRFAHSGSTAVSFVRRQQAHEKTPAPCGEARHHLIPAACTPSASNTGCRLRKCRAQPRLQAGPALALLQGSEAGGLAYNRQEDGHERRVLGRMKIARTVAPILGPGRLSGRGRPHCRTRIRVEPTAPAPPPRQESRLRRPWRQAQALQRELERDHRAPGLEGRPLERHGGVAGPGDTLFAHGRTRCSRRRPT
jgi:hypothetical protein